MWNLFSCFSDSSTYCSISTVKQKIVVKVQFSSEKRRTEAFKVAAGFRGVSNVTIEADKDEIVVIGTGIDSVCLARSLRKKLRYAVIASVEEGKKTTGEKKKDEEEKKLEVETVPVHYVHPYPVVCW